MSLVASFLGCAAMALWPGLTSWRDDHRRRLGWMPFIFRFPVVRAGSGSRLGRWVAAFIMAHHGAEAAEEFLDVALVPGGCVHCAVELLHAPSGPLVLFLSAVVRRVAQPVPGVCSHACRSCCRRQCAGSLHNVRRLDTIHGDLKGFVPSEMDGRHDPYCQGTFSAGRFSGGVAVAGIGNGSRSGVYRRRLL